MIKITYIPIKGVDPNRNFAHNWMVPDEDGNTGSSTSPCSDTFSGPYALSEPECATVDNFLNDNRGIFDTYIAVRKVRQGILQSLIKLNFQLHSYQHSFLYPYGNSRSAAVSKHFS